ncbi:MAG: PorT family protein [Candidatus Krumholzibacteriota bacterium]|nr:PorT family protein [Candidatus Krumholzibacteriota bacterium]
MKRFLVPVVFMLIAVMSQAAAAEGISFGVKGGMAVAGITDVPKFLDEDINWKGKARTGMAGGVYMKYPVAGSFIFQPELLFVMKGFKAEYEEEEGTIDMEGKFNYIEIPLIARFSIPLEGAFRPWFCFGPSIGFNMSDKVDMKIHGTGYRFNINVDADKAMNKTDFSIVLGGGFEYDIGSTALTFDIRYEHGLTKLIGGGDVTYEVVEWEDEMTEEIDEQKGKNKAFILMVGMAF